MINLDEFLNKIRSIKDNHEFQRIKSELLGKNSLLNLKFKELGKIPVEERKKTAEILKGEGDSERNKIFASAFGKDPAFFSFYRSMQSYEKALIGNETSLILSPDSDFFKFFGKSGARKFRSRSAKPAAKKN